jgi:hypothetical protein
MKKLYLFLSFLSLFSAFIQAQNSVGTGQIDCPEAGAIIITEIMQNPNTILDEDGEYFEIYNTTNSDIDMNGWEIRDLNNSSENFVITDSFVIAANSFAVFVRNGNSNLNGGIVNGYDYPDNYELSNAADEISIECNTAIIDRVLYDGGPEFPNPDGSSMELAFSAFNAIQNNFGSNWGEAVNQYSPNNNGTPGSTNNFNLSVTSFAKTQIQIVPNPVYNGITSIKTNDLTDLHVIIYNILGKKVKSIQMTNTTIDVSDLQPGVYILKINQNNYSTTKKLVIR